MTIKHPKTALAIWFGLGYLGFRYGLANVAYWIVFIVGALALYTIIGKQLDQK